MWTEPCLLEAAKTEYDGVIEDFLSVGEKLFGPYVWGRFVFIDPCMVCKDKMLKFDILIIFNWSTYDNNKISLVHM